MTTEERDLPEKSERDFLAYRSNGIPRIIRFVWTVFGFFLIFYLAKYAWPDLVQWFGGSR